MTAALSREDLRQRIDATECLIDVITAIDDVGSAEFAPGESVELKFTDSSKEKLSITTLHRLPPSLVVVGLRAMQKELEKAVNCTAEVV